jgi:peptidoglycan hydrolase-like protein with peptidoglycan-binding domain
MSGADVSSLQTFLEKYRTIYPQGMVTGYYGNLTKIAVTNFQKRNNILAIGRVGPVTLLALNAQMKSGTPVSSTPSYSYPYPSSGSSAYPADPGYVYNPSAATQNINGSVTSGVASAGTSTFVYGTTTLAVKLVPLLSGGTARLGSTIPVSYLQITNVGKASAVLKGFYLKQSGSAPSGAIIGLSTVDDKGGSRGFVGGTEGTILFKDGIAFAPTETTFAPGEIKLFTIKASLSSNQAFVGGQIIIDVTRLELTTGNAMRGTFPIPGTSWTIAQ